MKYFCIFINSYLAQWGRVTHICVGYLTIIGSDNGLSPNRRQAIIWTNAGLLFVDLLGTNFSDILIEINTFSVKKTDLKMSSTKWRIFRPGINVISRVSRQVVQSHHESNSYDCIDKYCLANCAHFPIGSEANRIWNSEMSHWICLAR